MQMLMREGIIINTKRRQEGNLSVEVPPVPSAEERYGDYCAKIAARGLTPKANSFPWAWKGKKKPKTFLSKKPKIRKRRMETVPV